MLHEASHVALPQHAGFCAHTCWTQASRHFCGSSGPPTAHTECAQVGAGAHGPQSDAQLLQSSVLSHLPLPQQEPHVWLAALAHCASHAMVQQYVSAAQIWSTHALQPVASALPVSHTEWAHVSPPLLLLLVLLLLDVPPQSFGQEAADSPGSHAPSPHTGPPDEDDDDDADDDDVVLLDVAPCEEEERVEVEVVVVKAPPAPPPAPAVKRSSTDRPHAATLAAPSTSTMAPARCGLPRLVGAEFMRMLPIRRLS